MGRITATAGTLVRVRKNCYLKYPHDGGKIYNSGQLLRLPTDMAKNLCHMPDGSRPICVMVPDPEGE